LKLRRNSYCIHIDMVNVSRFPIDATSACWLDGKEESRVENQANGEVSGRACEAGPLRAPQLPGGSGVNPSRGGEAINGRASKPETRSGEDRVGLPKAAPERRALREQASSNLNPER
jgi:hypothetical protein